MAGCLYNPCCLGGCPKRPFPAIKETGFVKTILSFHAMLPFSADGMAWVVPTFLGLVVALIHVKLTGEKPLSLG